MFDDSTMMLLSRSRTVLAACTILFVTAAGAAAAPLAPAAPSAPVTRLPSPFTSTSPADPMSTVGQVSPLEVLDTLSGRPADQKLAPDLKADQAKAGRAGQGNVTVVVESARRLDLSTWSPRVHQFTWPAGEQVAVVSLPARDLTTLAGLPGVARISAGTANASRDETAWQKRLHGKPPISVVSNSRQRSLAPARRPKDNLGPGIGVGHGRGELQTRPYTAHLGDGASDGSAPADDRHNPLAPAGLDGWWDVGLGHEATEAWALGFKGEGVRVGVLDTGVDFAHPDLQGTWAVYPAGQPEAGWPQVYDPTAAFQYTLDHTVNPEGHLTRNAGGTLIEMNQTSKVKEGVVEGETIHTACFSPLVGLADGSRDLGDEDCDYRVPAMSKSGTVRYGHDFDASLAYINSDPASNVDSEYVGVLLVDAHTPGVYDTVYVDTNSDHNFTDEITVTKESPLSYRDLDADGVADLSGGLLYYIADGKMPIPGAYLMGMEKDIPAAGSYVGLFADHEDHGTLCASAVVSQGRLGVPDSAADMVFRDLPGDGQPAAVNPGMAPKAMLAAVGDVYSSDIALEAGWRFAVLGADPQRPDDDMQVVSNSYGSSGDNDGWERESRMIDYYVRHFNAHATFLVATGNSGPGYGTISPPTPLTSINVAASTQFGAGAGPRITDTHQVTYGDIIPFSNRGPGAIGQNGPEVAANGAEGWGATPINPLSVDELINNPDMPVGAGPQALEVWAGTSRSTPAAAGALALAYQAFKSANGRWPDWLEARALTMAGARFDGYDVFTSGAGVVDAGDSVRLAAGQHGVYALPPEWTAGDYRGKVYPGFAQLVAPGAQSAQQFSLKNPSDHAIQVNVAGQALRKIGTTSDTLSMKLAAESPPNAKVPDYVRAIDKSKIPPGTDLMIVRTAIPLSQSDVNGDGNAGFENNLNLGVLRHTDIDGDGKLWTDADGNGVVNHDVLLDENGDPTEDVDWSKTELDQWEYELLNLNQADMNNKEVAVHHPLQRWGDGLYLAWWHPNTCDANNVCLGRSEKVPRLDIPIQIDFFAYQDWPWLSVGQKTLTIPPKSEAKLDATLAIPAGTAPGAYQGALFVDYARGAGDNPVPAGGGYELAGRRLVIPVNANVSAAYDWHGALTLGGTAGRDPGASYDNGLLRGALDRTSDSDTGDWRFFFLDATPPVTGTFWLAKTVWGDGSAEKSDVDTSLWGPSPDRFTDPNHPDNKDQNAADGSWYGPYGQEEVAASRTNYNGAGTWGFASSSGANEDWIGGQAAEGLHEIILHNDLFGGAAMGLPYTTTVSSAQVSPPVLSLAALQCAPLRITSQIDLPGLNLTAVGLSAPVVMKAETVLVGTPYTYDVNLATPAARFVVDLVGQPGTDLDLYVSYDADKNGQFDDGEQIAASESSSALEHIALSGAQPAGRYRLSVVPFSLQGNRTTFDLTVDIVSGTQLTTKNVPAELRAGQPATVQVCPVSPPDVTGPLSGVVAFGPQGGPDVLTVPVVWMREGAKPPAIYLPLTMREHTLP